MLNDTRPWTNAEAVFICWTNVVGCINPERYAMMNLSFFTAWPNAQRHQKRIGLVTAERDQH